MSYLSRRLFLVGAPLVLAGCASSRGIAPKPWSSSQSAYAESEDNGFVLAAIDLRKVDAQFLRREVADPTGEAPGSIVVDPDNHFLYHVREGGQAMRYGVGVGRQGFGWSGRAVIRRKAEWPTWTPPRAMVARDENAAEWASGMPGGPDNPLGARAMYLYQGNRDTLYRLHGTNDPSSIGKSMSSGCIRMLNQDIIHLYDNTPTGTRVIVLPSKGSDSVI